MHNDNYIVLSRSKQKVVTLEEAKRYLRIEADYTDDDDVVSSMVATAVLMAENYLGSCLHVQEIEQLLVNFYGSIVDLKRKPVIRIDKVFVWSQSNVRKNVDKSLYSLDERGGRLELSVPFISNGLGVIYRAGYEDHKLIPEPIKLGILNHIASLYDDRHLAVLPQASISLYAPYRCVSL
jgi:uncharacterized phiE125 gp8 family phage protein